MPGAPLGGGGGSLRLFVAAMLLVNLHAASLPAQIGGVFLRGDSNGDGELDLSDGINTLNFLFLGGREPPCLDASDANDDGELDLSDGVFVLNFLFTGGPAPPAPGPFIPGGDPTADGLGCGPPAPVDDGSLLEPPWSYAHTPAAPSPVPMPYPAGESLLPGIHLFSGEVTLEAVDITARAAVGPDLTLARIYRSRNPKSVPAGAHHSFLEPLGHGWDHSYNIHLLRDGDDIVVYNGHARFDRFRREADGSFWASGIFAEGRLEGRVFTLRFPHGGTWVFDLDAARRKEGEGNPWLGDISLIEDRHGNETTFTYDDSGRLRKVEEGGRHTPFHNKFLAFEYDTDGYLSSVTDDLGRRVLYARYVAGEAGGSPGDLKSVTTPAVTGTPHGNDFPQGKTVRFTWSAGFADERLNHNLLSIAGGKGATFLSFEYSPALDPADPSFDRVTTRVWGDPHVDEKDGTRWDFVTYSPLIPGPENGMAVMKAIVSGSSGNVGEHLFDGRNRPVELRRFTGRCDPSIPATETGNRPARKLRPEDPDVFVTRFSWNDDSLPTEVRWPEGSSEVREFQGDSTPIVRGSWRGNMVAVKRLAGPRGGEPAEIVERFEYDPATNAVVRAVDALGNATRFEVDGRGNVRRIIPPVEEAAEDFSYNEFGQLVESIGPRLADGRRPVERREYHGPEGGAEAGRLRRITQLGAPDAEGRGAIELVTLLEHDAAGNLSRRTDPRGNVSEWLWNQRDQLVQVSASYTKDGAMRVLRRLHHDADDLLVRVDEANLGADGAPDPENAAWTTIHGYDSSHRLTRSRREVSPAAIGPGASEVPPDLLDRFETIEYGYDAAGNLSLTRFPDAVDGTDPHHIVEVVHDERDLPFETRKAGSRQSVASTTRHRYDGNGNEVERLSGLPDVAPRRITHAYDGHDRRIQTRDAFGNTASFRHDAAGNLLSLESHGELLDEEGDKANTLLSRTAWTYDALRRPLSESSVHVHHKLFSVTRQPTPVGDGKSDSFYRWGGGDLPESVTDDNGGVTRFLTDGLGRLETVVDPAGNERRFERDGSSSVVRLTEREASRGADGTVTFEEFTTRYEHDPLDRLVSRTDPLGRTESLVLDSRSNVLETVDMAGNRVRRAYDGAGRLRSTSTLLTEDGTGGSPVVGSIERTFAWDRAGRLSAETDSSGNTTRWLHDSLDRPVTVRRADGTSERLSWDRHGNLVETQDPNGTLVRISYDLLDRPVRRETIPGPGVEPTGVQTFRHDGLCRLVRAEEGGSVVAMDHDSLGNVVREVQDGRTVEGEHDGESNLVLLVHPGGEKVEYRPDALGRPSRVLLGGAELASFEYAGPARLRQALRGGTVGSVLRWDGGRRLEQVVHGIASTPPRILHEHVYQHNQTDLEFVRRSSGTGIGHTFLWDSASRLVGSTTEVAGAPPSPIAYLLDGEGNRLSVTGGLFPGEYVRDATLPIPGDFQMDRYTRTPFDERGYDRNGSLTLARSTGAAGGESRFTHDALGRLLHLVEDSFSSSHTYRHDALGRRTVRRSGAPGTEGVEVRSIWYGDLLIEEEGADRRRRLHLHGGGGGGSGGRIAIRAVSADGAPPLDLFTLDDGRGRASALVDVKGAVLERYDHEDFGETRVFDADGKPLPASRHGNDILIERWQRAGLGHLLHDPLTGEVWDPRAGKVVSGGGGDGMGGNCGEKGRFAMSDNGWGSCFNCHPDGIVAQLSSSPPGRTHRVGWNTLADLGARWHRSDKSAGGGAGHGGEKDRALIGHELTHVAQSGGGRPALRTGGWGGGGGGGLGGFTPRLNTASQISKVKVRAWDPKKKEEIIGRWGGGGGGGLGGFIPRLSSASQITKVIVRGWDPQQKKAIIGRAEPRSAARGYPFDPDIRETTTGLDVEYRLYGPGAAHWGQAKFSSRSLGGSKELQAWWMEAAKGKNIRKSITVNLHRSDKTAGRGYNLFESFPTRWDTGDYSPSSTVQTETLTVKMGRVEFKT